MLYSCQLFVNCQFFMGILLVSLLSGLAMDLSRIVPVVIGFFLGAVSKHFVAIHSLPVVLHWNTPFKSVPGAK